MFGLAWGVTMVRRDRARFLIGSLGLGIALSGLFIFLGQMYRAIHTGRLEAVPVRSVLSDPLLRENVPTTVTAWFQWIIGSFEMEGLVAWLVDEIPLAFILIVVGGITAWRSLSWESPVSRRR